MIRDPLDIDRPQTFWTIDPVWSSRRRPDTAWVAPHIALPCRWPRRAVRAWHRAFRQRAGPTGTGTGRFRWRIASAGFVVKVHSPMGLLMILLSFFDECVFGCFLFDFLWWKWDGNGLSNGPVGTITLSIPQRKKGAPRTWWHLHGKKWTRGIRKYQTYLTCSCGKSNRKLSGWWFEPLWKIWKSIGMIITPTYGKIKNGNQTTNQKLCFWMFWPILGWWNPVGPTEAKNFLRDHVLPSSQPKSKKTAVFHSHWPRPTKAAIQSRWRLPRIWEIRMEIVGK